MAFRPGGYGEAGNSIDDALASATARSQAETRVIIYTGNMALVVKDTSDAIEAVTKLAEEKGGYVSGSDIYQSGDAPRGSITIRIPAELYQETLTALRAMAIRVERESSNTQDVTEEYTDLQARKTNLEYTEAALQELVATAVRMMDNTIAKIGSRYQAFLRIMNVKAVIRSMLIPSRA